MPLESLEKVQLGAAVGSLFFMLRPSDKPTWKRILLFAIGTIAASLTTDALVTYFHLEAGVSGGVGFFSAVIVLPVAETFIGFSENPQKLVDFIQGLWGGKKNNGGEDEH